MGRERRKELRHQRKEAKRQEKEARKALKREIQEIPYHAIMFSDSYETVKSLLHPKENIEALLTTAKATTDMKTWVDVAFLPSRIVVIRDPSTRKKEPYVVIIDESQVLDYELRVDKLETVLKIETDQRKYTLSFAGWGKPKFDLMVEEDGSGFIRELASTIEERRARKRRREEKERARILVEDGEDILEVSCEVPYEFGPLPKGFTFGWFGILKLTSKKLILQAHLHVDNKARRRYGEKEMKAAKKRIWEVPLSKVVNIHVTRGNVLDSAAMDLQIAGRPGPLVISMERAGIFAKALRTQLKRLSS